MLRWLLITLYIFPGISYLLASSAAVDSGASDAALISFPHAFPARIRSITPPTSPSCIPHPITDEESPISRDEFLTLLRAKGNRYVQPTSAMFCRATNAHWRNTLGNGTKILILEVNAGIPNTILSPKIQWLTTGDQTKDHAAHVAGIALQIAPNSQISVTSTMASSSDILSNADFINCSWTQSDPQRTSLFIPYNNLLRSYLGHSKTVVVFAAGNDGLTFEERDRRERSNLSSLSESQLSNTIFALNVRRKYSLSSCSNYPGRSFHHLSKHCISALGSDVFSTCCGQKFKVKSGTSMATPTISGALGLLKSIYPGKTAVWYKECLIESAEKNFFVCYDGNTGVFVHDTTKEAPSRHTIQHLNRFGFFSSQPFETVEAIYGAGILSVENMLLYAHFKEKFPELSPRKIQFKIRQYKNITTKHALNVINQFTKKHIGPWRLKHPAKAEPTAWAGIDADEWSKTVSSDIHAKDEKHTKYIWALRHRFFGLADSLTQNDGWHFFTSPSKKLSTWELCIENNDPGMALCLAEHPIPTDGTFPRHLMRRAHELDRTSITDILSRAITHSMDRNDPKSFTTLIQEGFRPKKPDRVGRYPIHAAIDMSDMQSLKILCANSPDVCTPSPQGVLPWRWVLENNLPDVFAELSKNPNFVMNYSAARLAIRTIPERSRAPFQKIIDVPLQLRKKDQHGRYPIHVAILNRDIPLVLKIVTNDDFAFNTPAPDGVVPWVWAIENRQDVFKAMATTTGPRIYSWMSPNGDRPLHLATRMGLFDLAEFMLENGAHLNSHNKSGNTPHQIARYSQKRAFLELFREHRV